MFDIKLSSAKGAVQTVSFCRYASPFFIYHMKATSLPHIQRKKEKTEKKEKKNAAFSRWFDRAWSRFLSLFFYSLNRQTPLSKKSGKTRTGLTFTKTWRTTYLCICFLIKFKDRNAIIAFKMEKHKPMHQDEFTLYVLIGEALCMIQHLEDALSHALVLRKEVKRPNGIPKANADFFLKKYRSYTLGKAISIAKKEQLYTNQLQKELEEFLLKRNWLVHKSIAQNRDEWDLNISRGKLFNGIKAITKQAQRLQILIEDDLINFSETNGVDMSRVRAEIMKNRTQK